MRNLCRLKPPPCHYSALRTPMLPSPTLSGCPLLEQARSPISAAQNRWRRTSLVWEVFGIDQYANLENGDAPEKFSDARPHLLSFPLRLHCVSTRSRRSQRQRRTGEGIAAVRFWFCG